MTDPHAEPDRTGREGRPPPTGDGEQPLPRGGPTDGLRAIDPDLALRPGQFDAAALLVVWILRRSFVPLLGLGFALVVAVSDGTEAPADLSSPTQLASVLLTPWVGVALAVLVRLLANALAWLLAVPLTDAARPRSYDGMASTRWLRAGTDRLRLARAYRELRWTWPVRQRAAERSGRLGKRLLLVDRAVTILTVAVISVPLVLVVVGMTRLLMG